MFSTKLSRAAAGAVTVSASPSSATAHRATACLASRSRPSHQRRPSSSKASCPPNSSHNSSKPAPATKAADVVDDKSSLTHATPQSRTPKRMSRTKRSKSLASGDKLEDHFAGLPAVPGTQHISQSDLSVSSFFSLHRPLDLKHTVPPISSAESFNSIFEPRKPVNTWANGNSAEGRPEDVIYALGSLFESTDIHDEGVRNDILHESTSNSDGIKHLDGPPRQKTMDELLAVRPFNPPPPPEPFLEEHKTTSIQRKPASKSKTVTVTAFITADGSPRLELRMPSAEDMANMEEPYSESSGSRFPHRERRLERSRAYWLRQSTRMRDAPGQKRKMLLISVKRQRKLKMKKHKYKKLMKRTRNLRRRQDRA